MESIVIIGAGNSGLAMAAHLSTTGHKVRLWNRSQETIEKLQKYRYINCKGLIHKKAKLEMVTTDIKEALRDSHLILVTTPANSHKDIAAKMAPHLNNDNLIILNPGRTFGAFEFSNILKMSRCSANPKIAETQTIIYTCRKIGPNTVTILSYKKNVLLCSLDPRQNKDIINQLPIPLQNHLIPASSIIETSFGNVGMILHCAPTILNTGWIESPKTIFKYYYEGITPSISAFLEKIDKERLTVAKMLGKKLESTTDWLKRSYGISGSNLYDCIHNNVAYKTIDAPKSLKHRYLYEDIPCGLVPLEAIGNLIGVPVPMCSLVINIASEIVNEDFRKTGRNLNQLGLEGKNAKQLIKHFN